MQPYLQNVIENVFTGIIQQNTSNEVNKWLYEKADAVRNEINATQLNLTFASIPRKTGKKIISISEDDQQKIREVYPGFLINNWTIDQMCRIWLLMQIPSLDQSAYLKKIQGLFKAAEMNELAALYAGLITYKYPKEWQNQCVEGIRSNIGLVLEAIMYNNPYPYQYLTGQAWNQLVLKAFFTEKDVKQIIGLDERANPELATILIDYANERWAAHRAVNLQLWRLVAPFINETNFSSIKKAFNSNDVSEKKAAALACFTSNYKPAIQLLEEDQDLKSTIVEDKLNWNSL